ncbi:MAG: adenylate/guanylate cyclase domain-containing protein [Flavobacteriaceae bacterium]|nr:adenylate/guanylate cyclase domain-containing protein [Flavobacteriaceae bacterium]
MIIPSRQRHYWKQALFFAFIWCVSALLYAIVEFGLLGNAKYYPISGNVYSFKGSILYAGTFSFVIGWLQGWIEVAWLRRRFHNNTLWLKVLAKILFYICFITLFLTSLIIITNSLLLEIPIWDLRVFESLWMFMTTFTFWSIMIYIAVTLSVAILFSEVIEYFGMKRLIDFILGRYHRPNQETRIFMFLDMKSSTTIAEQIGHEKYFELIKKYYSDMTQPILDTAGDIYQYVGDEIVVSWLHKKGIENDNCVECFRKISESISKNKDSYLREFGVVPEFKAGFHVGEVTTGEIGIIKKDIIYTGDVLNTTARIQAECNKYNVQILLSEKLYAQLSLEEAVQGNEIGSLQLRGKRGSTKLYSLSFEL